MTPAEQLTRDLAALPREHRARVLGILELFNALTPKHRRAWLEQTRPNAARGSVIPLEDAAALFERGQRLVETCYGLGGEYPHKIGSLGQCPDWGDYLARTAEQKSQPHP